MIYLLLVAAACFIAAYCMKRAYKDSPDDFLTPVIVFFLVVLGTVLSAIYLAAAFWNHRFW